MYISDYIGAPTKGHKHFDFVDSNIDGDNRLFIDNRLVGDENYILGILAKARKYDEIMAERERLFLNE